MKILSIMLFISLICIVNLGCQRKSLDSTYKQGGIEIKWEGDLVFPASYWTVPGGPETGGSVDAYSVYVPSLDIYFLYYDFFQNKETISDRFVLSGRTLSIDSNYVTLTVLEDKGNSREQKQGELMDVIKQQMRSDCPLLSNGDILTSGSILFTSGSQFLSPRYQLLQYNWQDKWAQGICPFMQSELSIVSFIYDMRNPSHILVLTVEDGVAPAPSKHWIETLSW